MQQMIAYDPGKNKATMEPGAAPAGRIVDRPAAALRGVLPGLIWRHGDRGRGVSQGARTADPYAVLRAISLRSAARLRGREVLSDADSRLSRLPAFRYHNAETVTRI
jgi:hypothetical protein